MAQTQTAALPNIDGFTIPHTFASDAYSGDILEVGSIPYLVVRDVDVSVNALGSLQAAGVVKVPQKAEIISEGDAVYWDDAGDPVTGTAGTGACTATATSNVLMGAAVVADTAATDTYCYVRLTAAERTATIAGSVTADDITGSDSSLGIAGISAAQGGAIVIAGGTSATSANAGGAVTTTGGVAGATGAGGAVTVGGSAGGATSGTGGATSITTGAGTNGNANSGALSIDVGAANGSGTDGAITIGGTNASSITYGAMPRIPTATAAAANSAQNNGTSVLEGFTTVTAADGTKAIVLPTAVAGMRVIIKNVADNVLKVFPAASDAINAAAANAVYNQTNLAFRHYVAYDATTWHTDPETIA